MSETLLETPDESDHIRSYLKDELWGIMLKQGLSKADMARKLGVSRARVSQIYSGEVSVDALVGYLNELGYSVTFDVKEFK